MPISLVNSSSKAFSCYLYAVVLGKEYFQYLVPISRSITFHFESIGFQTPLPGFRILLPGFRIPQIRLANITTEVAPQ